MSVTDAQRHLIVELTAAGLSAEQIAKAQGIARATIARVLSSATTARAIRDIVAKRVIAVAPVALATLEQLLNDPSVNDRVRLEAAKTILDRAGIPAQRPQDPENDGKSLSEMSSDELRAYIRRGEAAKRLVADRAEPVNAPSGPVIDAQTSDLL